MYANITGETPIAALTVSQFVDLLDKHKSAPAAPSAPARDYTQGYAYGLKGIRKLFGVSHATAAVLAVSSGESSAWTDTGVSGAVASICVAV